MKESNLPGYPVNIDEEVQDLIFREARGSETKIEKFVPPLRRNKTPTSGNTIGLPRTTSRKAKHTQRSPLDKIKSDTYRSSSLESGRISRRAHLRKSLSLIDLKKNEMKKSFKKSKESPEKLFSSTWNSST